MSDFAPLLAGTFRANAAFELVLFDRLAPAERSALAGLRGDPSFYGVLRPRADSRELGFKAVDRETALLVLTLAVPAALPGYVREVFGADTGRAVARLVADGVLEIDAGGGFVSGAGALALLAGGAGGTDGTDGDIGGEAGATPGARGGGRIAALSRQALRYAQALPIDEALALAARIYGYNRLPVTPRWRGLLPDAAAHARHLGTAPGGPAAAELAQRWTPGAASSGAWISWRPARPWRGSEGHAVGGGAPATHKLYVSPAPEALGEGGFAAIVAALTAARPLQFKVGAGAAGLLRPDKIVAYFADFAALGEAAARVRERLDGLPAHGVPFSAEIGADGLLSWGMDPPPGSGLPWSGAESWRLWLAQRLARALLAARGAARREGNGQAGVRTGAEPWRFAVERLRLEGIDTGSWTPAGRVFEET